MFRFITVNYIKRKLKMNNIVYINSKYRFRPKMNLMNKDDEKREVVISGSKKYIYVFDTKTNHELYNGKAKRFEMIMYRKGNIKPIAYVDLDRTLTEVLGTKNINYDSIKLKKLISTWLYTNSNIFDSVYLFGSQKDFDKASFDLYLNIFSFIIRRIESEFRL